MYPALTGDVSIHAPRVRCDSITCIFAGRTAGFNPRTSCEVRQSNSDAITIYQRFNPRTSCEVRQKRTLRRYVTCFVSIHAPRVRCDREDIRPLKNGEVSIHAPRVRCDNIYLTVFSLLVCFNPRTSCEVRLRVCRVPGVIRSFNPRTSCEVRLTHIVLI